MHFKNFNFNSEREIQKMKWHFYYIFPFVSSRAFQNIFPIFCMTIFEDLNLNVTNEAQARKFNWALRSKFT